MDLLLTHELIKELFILNPRFEGGIESDGKTFAETSSAVNSAKDQPKDNQTD